MVEGGCSPFNYLRWQQMAAAFITTEAFTGFAAGNLQVLRQFLSKPAPITFFNIGANGIKTTHLLFYQFTSSKIPGKDFRVRPKLVKELASQFVNPE